MLRRNKTKKLIKLTDGNLVIDFTIPTKLLENLPRKEGAEFTHTRVSYVTCGVRCSYSPSSRCSS